MPLYEYICRSCGKKSEFLVRNSKDKPSCDCGNRKLERVFSAFAVPGSEHKPLQNPGSCSSSCCGGSCGID